MRLKRQENGDFWWLKKPETPNTNTDAVDSKNKDSDDKQAEKEAEIEVAEKNGQGIHFIKQSNN